MLYNNRIYKVIVIYTIKRKQNNSIFGVRSTTKVHIKSKINTLFFFFFFLEYIHLYTYHSNNTNIGKNVMTLFGHAA